MGAVAQECELRTRDRKRGHPTTQVTFRCPEELAKAAATEGRDKTEGFTVLLDRAVDAKETMGEAYRQLVVYAHLEDITEGEALGRLAKIGLEALAKKKH